MTALTQYPLAGHAALVTGVSRRRGIGYAIAVRLAQLGASVFIQHFSPHDAGQPWGADDLDAVRRGIREAGVAGAAFGDVSADLAEADSARRVVDEAARAVGRLDILVCNHARSGGDGSIFDMTPQRLDGHWQVNTRSTLLLTRHFAEQFAAPRVDVAPGASAAPLPGREGGAAHQGGTDASAPAASDAPADTAHPTAPGVRASRHPVDEFATGRVIWMTSGQHDGPMPGEVAYATSKAALAGVTATVASELLARLIILNTVNPGPVNTGYLDPETTDRPLDELQAHIAQTPFGRFGDPADPARLIGWLVTDDARWIVGQVITSDGGFRL